LVQPVKKETEDTSKTESKDDLKKQAVQHPLVAEAVRIFGGRVVDVKVL